MDVWPKFACICTCYTLLVADAMAQSDQTRLKPLIASSLFTYRQVWIGYICCRHSPTNKDHSRIQSFGRHTLDCCINQQLSANPPLFYSVDALYNRCLGYTYCSKNTNCACYIFCLFKYHSYRNIVEILWHFD